MIVCYEVEDIVIQVDNELEVGEKQCQMEWHVMEKKVV